MTNVGEPLVSVRNLRIQAGSPDSPMNILRGVDMDIGRGRIVGVVGESGSGKSTLASAIIGLLASNLKIASGAIRFAEHDLLAMGEGGRRKLRGDRIAMIFQDPMTVLNPVFTVGTQLIDVARRKSPGLGRSEARRRAEDMLSTVGIPDPAARLRSYPHQLSGGMRQRVMIAMALLTDAELILADEPTTALDATVEAQIVDLFKNLRAEMDGSLLFISHHLGLLAELCDDVVVMYAGTVVESGPMVEVISAPSHPYTAALLACEIDDAPDGSPLVTIPGGPPDPRQDEAAGCLFAARCPRVDEVCTAGPPPMVEARPGIFARCARIGDGRP